MLQQILRLLHENKRLGLATRSEKIHLNYYLTRLAQEGVDYRNGNVYVPSKMTLTKDQIDLLNDARKAVKAFNNAVNI